MDKKVNPKTVKPRKAVKPESKKVLANVPEENVFWCCDGGIYHNMQELRDALNTMPVATYVYHVNAAKNDFTNWVRDIIQDEELADALFEAQTPEEAAREVTIRITFLTRN